MQRLLFLVLFLLLCLSCSQRKQDRLSSKEQLKESNRVSVDREGFVEIYEKSIIQDYRVYKQVISEDVYVYSQKIYYESNYEAEQLLENAKGLAEPYDSVKKAFDIHAEMQEGIFAIFNKKEKQQYMQEHKGYVQSLFQASKTKKQIEETFNCWLNYKRTLFDGENSILIHPVMSAKKKIIERKKRLLAQAFQVKDLSEISLLKKDISNFEKSLSTDIFHQLKKKSIQFSEISEYLEEDELYLDFAKIDRFYYLFILNKKKNLSFKRFDALHINNLLFEIQKETKNIVEGKTFANLKKAKEQYGKIYDLIFLGMDIQHKKSLIVSTDGLLSLMPFEAFYNRENQKYLIETIQISYIPSAKELLNLYKKKINRNDKIIVFANPDFGSDIEQYFLPLNGTEKEASIIKKVYPNSQVYQNKEASEKNFFKIFQPKILHLSTHGFFLKNKKVINPMLKSGIALSGANYAIKNRNGEGIVTALELSGLNLKGTELVVLSACETGVGEVEEAEGVAGINKAFMKAGARYIIMSLWSVSDKATATLMENFYINIKDEKSYGTALHDAKLKMIRNGNAHPYYWSGFVGSGLSQ